MLPDRGIGLIGHDPLLGVRYRVGKLTRTVDIVGPAEHLTGDVDIAENVGDEPVVRLAPDVVEGHWTGAVEMPLQARHLKVGATSLSVSMKSPCEFSHSSVPRRSPAPFAAAISFFKADLFIPDLLPSAAQNLLFS